MKYVAVRRDARFSPHSEDKDYLILHDVCKKIKEEERLTNDILIVEESIFSKSPEMAKGYITMARSKDALDVLGQVESQGSVVVNSSIGVKQCQRSLLDTLMRNHHIAMPPLKGTHGYWLKRGDAAAQDKRDIMFCKDEQALQKAKASFLNRGITDLVVSVHMVGDLVKFYGVGERMFRYFYPTDDGISKFGDERLNGQAHHYAFNIYNLRKEVERLAQLVGIDVYGGDAIIDSDGHFYIIDFNDWPSFSRCRDEAATAIANLIIEKINGKQYSNNQN